MTYNTVRTGRFLSRPNRFIAIVDIDGVDTVCHVKIPAVARNCLSPAVPSYWSRQPTPIARHLTT